MIDIGKKDVLGYGQLDMSRFAHNCTFTCFDGWEMIKKGGDGEHNLRELTQEVMDLYEQGHVKPIRPISVFGVTNIEDAYRYMQQGQHVGKIVIRSIDAEEEPLVATPSVPLPSFRDDASYLLVGGMGGLGKAIASWMVDNGEKSMIFLSRSAGQSNEDKALKAELEEAGCKVHCCAGDVSDADVVSSVVNNAPLPIAGVLQLAMVLKDVATLEMDINSWLAVTRPKVEGTWNLHKHLPGVLDFFVLFSSIGGMFGYPGQANYASSGSFLDAFVQYRHSLGRVASVIDVGPIDDIGHVAMTPASRENLPSCTILVSEQELLDTVQLAMTTALPDQRHDNLLNRQQMMQLPWATMALTDAGNPTLWKRDPRIALYRNLESKPRGELQDEESQRIRAYIRELAVDQRRFDNKETLEFFAHAIRRCVAAFVMKDEDELDLDLGLEARGRGLTRGD